jgi:4-amino-4-deoxy-L-arabinose transferase-like glycosyltransferase
MTDRPAGAGDRRFVLWLAAIAAGGLALRLLHVFVLTPDTQGTGDAFFFHEQANLIADGKGFIEPLGEVLYGEGQPTAFRPPLFSYTLAAVSLIGGEGWPSHRVAGCLIGLATIVFVGLAARRYAGERAGLVAAALAAAYPVMIAADGAVMSESLYSALIAVTVFAAVRLQDDPTALAAALLGVAIGLAALTRSEALLLVPLLALPLAWRAGPRARVRLAVAATLAAVVVVIPWTVRNYVEFDRVVPVTASYGALLAGANCDVVYEHPGIGAWVIDCIPRGPGVPTGEIERNSYNTDVALDYMGDHLGQLPAVATFRVLRTFDLWQPFEQARHSEGREPTFATIGVLSWFLLMPFALYGAVLLRRRGRPLLPLLAPVVLVVAISLASWGTPRFRAAADVSAVICAAVALTSRARR